MSLSPSEIQLTVLLGSILNGEEPEIPSGADWNEIFRIARRQHILPVLFERVRTTEAAAQQELLFQLTKQDVTNRVVHGIMQNAEFSYIYGKLREGGVHPVLLKGTLCSALYPDPIYRVSVDMDILVNDDEIESCHALLCGLGYAPARDNIDLHCEQEISYLSADQQFNIEVHRLLFEEVDVLLNAPFEGYANSVSEIGDVLSLSPEMHFLFLIFHAYKHFFYCGVGIRQVCDIGLWGRKYAEQIDWDFVLRACEQANAAYFAATVFDIARKRFRITLPMTEEWEQYICSDEDLLADMMEGGVYGSVTLARLHTATVTRKAVLAQNNGTDDTRRITVWHSLFPPVSYFRANYPYLKRFPVLLPIAWLSRIFHYIGEVLLGKGSPRESVRLTEQRLALLRKYHVLK